MGCKKQHIYFNIGLFSIIKFHFTKKVLNKKFEALSWDMNQILSKN